MPANSNLNVSTVYPPRWLHWQDLARPTTAAIAAVTLEAIYNPHTGQTQPRLVLTFHERTRRLILNRTQAHDLAHQTGHDDAGRWIGYVVQLAPNPKEHTIKITIQASSSAPPDQSA